MDYDAAFIGSGAGGYYSAIRLLKHGKKVLIIEKKNLAVNALIMDAYPQRP
jgi:dihydrolipoamide dehydrogenase (EC 1.8.1.4)